jgi:hypothetical protein
MRGVVARQVGVGVRIAEVVDRDDGNLVVATVLVERPEDVASDAAVTIDANLDRHCPFSLKLPAGLADPGGKLKAECD